MRNKKIRGAKPVGKFKSHLEQRMSQLLEKYEIPADYEEHKFVLQDKFRYESPVIKGKKQDIMVNEQPSVRAITYTPDFVNTELGFVIECKGFPNDSFPLKWKMFKKYLVDNNLNYDLYIPRNFDQCEVVAKIILSNL